MMDRFLNTIKHKKIPHEKTCYVGFPFKGGRFIQVKRTKLDKRGITKGWPRPLNTGNNYSECIGKKSGL